MEFRILGPLEVSVRGKPVPLGREAERTLLAILLVHANQVVSVDRLVDELWGDCPPERARKVLQVYISRLRKALQSFDDDGHPRLATRGPGYMLNVETDELDSLRFSGLSGEGRRALAAGDAELAADRLREALDLWRGPPLSDFVYERFAQGEIAQLEDLYLSTVEDRIDADLAQGRHRELVGELERLVSEHPLRERLAAQLMLALYRSGRQAEALDVFQRTRRMLIDELGLEPGEALRDLQQAILRQAPELRVQPKPVVAPEPPTHAQRRTVIVLAAAATAVAIAALIVLISRGGAAGPRVQPNSVAAIDPKTGRVVADIAVGSRPATLSFGDGALWIANLDDDSVSRIDAHARQVVRTIPTGETPAGLAAGQNGVWVASPDGSLGVIDPTFNVVRTLATGSRGYLTAVDLPSPAAAGDGAIWVVNKTTVERIEPASGRVAQSTGVGLSPAGIAVGDGSIWVADATQNTVTRIDPATNTSITTPVGHGPTAIVASPGSVWVADSTDDAVIRIDPQTNAVTTTIPVGRVPTGLALGGGSLWAANSASGTVSRIDPATGRVTQTIHVGSSPAGVTFADGLLWVSVQANAIGAPGVGPTNAARFDLLTDTDMLSLDPAITSAPDPWQIEYATCAKLFNFPDESGQAALQPLPEVSAAPQVSANRRTYTFRIGPRFRFSPPSDAPVTAQTFRATIERTLAPRMHSPIAPFMRDIVGANAYMTGRSAHISGVSARGAVLTIRLLAPDPTLLVKLAMPYFCAVPAGTPVEPAGVAGIPSAGPYYVSSYVPGQRIVLRRNPNYRGTRPHRIPEFIYTMGIDPSKSVQRIEGEKSDYLVNTQVGVLPYADHLRLLARYGPGSHAARSGRQQYFINPTPGPLVIWLNTRRPLFAHINLRRALNYAIDRAALIHEIEQSGGPVFLPTDQYLTPGTPGYQPIDVYPLDHPDLAAARQLAGPGRHGTAIFLSGVYDSQNDQIVARALRAIGIDVVIKRLPLNALFAEEHTANAPFDLVSGGIGIDYPDPYDILNTELDGNQITAHQNDNVSQFNDPTYNHELEAAAQLSGTARYRAYAKLDADLVTNAAPMVAFASGTSQDFFSARIGCQTYQPVFGMDLAALCFRR